MIGIDVAAATIALGLGAVLNLGALAFAFYLRRH